MELFKKKMKETPTTTAVIGDKVEKQRTIDEILIDMPDIEYRKTVVTLLLDIQDRLERAENASK